MEQSTYKKQYEAKNIKGKKKKITQFLKNYLKLFKGKS